MKKALITFLGLVLFSGSAMAAGIAGSKGLVYGINPEVSVATFEDADTTTGVGVNGFVENLLVDETVTSVGVNFYDLGTTDLYRFPVTVGYNFDVAGLTVTPNVGFVVDTLDTDKNDVESSFGFTTGADVTFKITENLDASAGVAYVANETDGTNLDGFTFSGGLIYNW